MKKKKYFFRDGTPFNQDEAQSVGEYLELRFPKAQIKPRAIVDDAKRKASPLHKYFDWDDKSAADKFRLGMARKIIHSLYIKIDDNEVRAYEHVYLKASDESSYMTTEEIFSSKELYKQVILEAKRELLFWERKYVLYKDHLPQIFSAIAGIKEKANEE